MAITRLNAHAAHCYRRRGVSYVYFLAMTMLVTVIGMSSLTYAHIQWRSAQGGDQSIAARFYAQSALELGYAEIHRDTGWRNNLGEGAWFTDMPIGEGTLSLDVTILTDADSDPDNNPAVLVATGVHGDVIHVLEVTLGSLSEKGGLTTTAGSGKRNTGTAE